MLGASSGAVAVDGSPAPALDIPAPPVGATRVTCAPDLIAATSPGALHTRTLRAGEPGPLVCCNAPASHHAGPLRQPLPSGEPGGGCGQGAPLRSRPAHALLPNLPAELHCSLRRSVRTARSLLIRGSAAGARQRQEGGQRTALRRGLPPRSAALPLAPVAPVVAPAAPAVPASGSCSSCSSCLWLLQLMQILPPVPAAPAVPASGSCSSCSSCSSSL